MTEIEIAEQKLAGLRAQRCSAERSGDFALEEALARDSYAAWCELERLKGSSILLYQAYDFNRVTGEVGRWRGVATAGTIAKLGLAADLWYPLYDREGGAVDGWAFKAP
jgi:hypothetical protein